MYYVDVHCGSSDNQYNTCPLDFPIRNVVVKDQHSKSVCTKDVSFGISDDRKSIWVDNGCRATFTVTIEYQGKYKTGTKTGLWQPD